MGLGHGLHKDGEAGAQLFLQLLGLRDGVGPSLVGRVHPVFQILPPVRPAAQEQEQTSQDFYY